jgi:hypothetical protein
MLRRLNPNIWKTFDELFISHPKGQFPIAIFNFCWDDGQEHELRYYVYRFSQSANVPNGAILCIYLDRMSLSDGSVHSLEALIAVLEEGAPRVEELNKQLEIMQLIWFLTVSIWSAWAVLFNQQINTASKSKLLLLAYCATTMPTAPALAFELVATLNPRPFSTTISAARMSLPTSMRGRWGHTACHTAAYLQGREAQQRLVNDAQCRPLRKVVLL